MKKTKAQSQISNRIYANLSLIMAGVLLVVGIFALWAHNFTSNMVRTELAAQKVYFPEKGSAGFDADTYPDLQQYAGQLVDSPEKAKAYANGYIGRHLAKTAGGKVYSEVSAESMKDPTNEKLQSQKQTLFQGETLRGVLLTSGYGFGTVGEIAGIAAVVVFLASAGLAATAGYFYLKR